ncbi:MAG: LPS export ABC transporter periplasmic protein LptC [Alphaproteobacteria bacterium]
MIQTAHHSMDLWGPRRATSLKEARRRTAIVHIIRLLFTCAAVVSAGVLLGPVVKKAMGPTSAPLTSPTLNVTMLNPRFEGIDAGGQPYVIIADTARRRRENVSLVDLVNPRLEDKTSSNVKAREGVYDRDAQVLDLIGDVVMTDAAGYTFTADKTRMFIKENRVEGATPLHGFGAVGEVKADSYEVLDDGNRIILKGHVWTRIVPKSGGG